MLSKDGEMTRFRFSFIRVSTGSALSRREEERRYCFQDEETPDWQLLQLRALQREEGTRGHLLQGGAALAPGEEALTTAHPILLGWPEAWPFLQHLAG